jgi:CheY-like chemotaxis protein
MKEEEMRKLAWQTRNEGVLVASQDFLDLMVCRPADRGSCHESVHFLVGARDKAMPNAIIGCGLAESMTQGMTLAEAMANRFGRDAPAGSAQVMVVDDDISVRNSLADALRDDGYEVVEAASAEGALRRLERIRRPVVLVTDVNLGDGMSGLELAAEVQQLWPAVSILLISGDDEELAAGQATTIAFLPKPMSTNRLLERVATMFTNMCPAHTSA